MAKSTALDTLIDRAEQRTDDALQAMGQAQGRCNQASQQLDALGDYRHDYQLRLQQAMRTGMSTGNYSNYVAFLDSLDGAIGQQRGLLQRQQQQLDDCRQQWQQEKRSLDAYSTLAERRAREQASAAQRLEQRLTDEYASRRRSAPLDPHL